MENTILITKQAAEKIREIMQKKGKPALRVGLVSVSCSSYVYNLDFEENPSAEDIVAESSGIKVHIAKKSIKMLAGLEIGYDAQKQGFVINNPNIKKKTGLPVLD